MREHSGVHESDKAALFEGTLHSDIDHRGWELNPGHGMPPTLRGENGITAHVVGLRESVHVAGNLLPSGEIEWCVTRIKLRERKNGDDRTKMQVLWREGSGEVEVLGGDE